MKTSMSKIQWEYDVVEKHFCQQLQAMGWQWIEGDTDVPDFTEPQNFRAGEHSGNSPGAAKSEMRLQ